MTWCASCVAGDAGPWISGSQLPLPLDRRLPAGVRGPASVLRPTTTPQGGAIMRTQAAVVLGLFLAGTASAVQPTPFTGFLHRSPTPQPVPDGTSTFVLSPTAPTGSPVVTEQISVIKTQSASFPAFIAPPFPKDT